MVGALTVVLGGTVAVSWLAFGGSASFRGPLRALEDAWPLIYGSQAVFAAIVGFVAVGHSSRGRSAGVARSSRSSRRGSASSSCCSSAARTPSRVSWCPKSPGSTGSSARAARSSRSLALVGRVGRLRRSPASGAHGRGEIDPALVERATHDRARAAELADRADVVERGDPARGDDLRLDRARRGGRAGRGPGPPAGRPARWRWLRRSSRPGPRAPRGRPRRGRRRAPARQPSPSARPSRTSRATAIRSGPWVATRRPAKAGSRSAAVPTTARAAPAARAGATDASVRRPPATSTATSVADGVDDVADDRGVCRLPGPGSVEVDDVEPPRPCVRERPRHRDRVVGERGLPLEIALLPGERRDRRAGRSPAGCRSRLSPSVHRVSVLAR